MLSNYTVIITGASSGMGKGFAEAFLAEGANIVINARRREVLEQFAIDNVEYIDRIRYVAGDISDASTSKALAQEALSAFGRIDLLINNAGTFIPKPFLEETEESLDHYYSVAMKGSYLATQAVIPAMQEQQGGSIINIGSMWVENPLEATPCSASQIAKGGMHS
ncbi:3-oxoacyl-(acyl-carrier protein) reductase [Vibrio sp. JCM 19236]|nr:3-oxoacyl-(acyl-carrier protein) reductase [Vibrio sp. JCM 19236]